MIVLSLRCPTVLAGILASWLAMLSALGATAAHAAVSAETTRKPELKVAVLAFRGTERARQRWQSSMDYLSRQIPDYRFVAVPMTLEQLDQAVIDGAVDFAVTNAGQYVRVGSRYGLSALATLKSRRHPDRDQVIGSALLVRADSAYQTLPDLRQARLGAVSPLAFGGFHIYGGEMLGQGYRPERFFSEVKFAGFPVGVLAFWVRDRVVDAAVVPACLLEQLDSEGMLAREQFRVVDAKPTADFDCQTSSRLYPNWSFAALKATSPTLAAQVAQALLALPTQSEAARDSGALGWTAPVSSHEIHQLYQSLDIHPWQDPWWQELREWLWLHWQWSLALLLVMLAGFSHHLWAQLMMNRRTRQLKAVHADLIHQQQQLEHAQRVAILGELSSDLAHELNQPLAAISSYADGGIIRLENDMPAEELAPLLTRISTEAHRGAAIIERIRGFARPQQARRELLDLGSLIRETVKLLDYELHKQPLALQLELLEMPDKPLMLAVDPIEVQQLLVNLIRNALEAMAENAGERRLRLACRMLDADTVEIGIQDNGVGIDGAKQQVLFKPFYTTKPQGLGLGLSICKRIVDVHGGELSMAPVEGGGTLVRCTLKGELPDGS